MRDASFSASHFQRLPAEGGAKGKGRHSIFARLFGARRLSATIILGIAGVAAIGVPMNALFFQDGRHPAPLFSAQIPVAPKAETPTPPARPATIETARVEPDPATSEKLRPAPKISAANRMEKIDASRTDASRTDASRTDAGKSETPRATGKKRDPIGQLLAGGATQAGKPDNNVLYAQRALLKLGYVVRPDGVLGAGTRQALEKFEHDSGLAVRGELTPKLMRQLATRAGLARQ